MAGIAASSVAGATVLNGTIANFDADADGIADDLNIARITFNVSAGTQVFFDVLARESTGVDLNGDGLITGFDSYLMLFDARGNTLTIGDDWMAPTPDGSVDFFDSAIRWTFAEAGTYMITLGQGTYFQDEALQGYEANRPYDAFIGNQNFGAWRLTMTATGGTLSDVVQDGVPVSQVPEPGSLLLLGAGLAGVAAARRKRAARL
ncbi:DVUA0089 family protein [Massilia sp. 9I]|uniref:DVUA0089 family protein n=1 Tax=Massilia sp. 9I TaxID=2653152 RepID=UPI0019168F57|nr:DVUA0089 family protein [Massilia sp. 9I]